MHISRKILIAALALGVVAIEAASAPAYATTSTTTMSIGLTIVAPGSIPARHANSASKAGAAPTSTGKTTIDTGLRHDIRHSLDEPRIAALTGTTVVAKNTAIQPEVTTHTIVGAHAGREIVTLSY